MEALAAWLKQIIVVVLLATFIDLLLPNRTMQRYVKLVVSLFILMTILTPVMQLFGTSANLRMLAAAVEGWTLSGTQHATCIPDPSHEASSYPRSSAIPALSDLLRRVKRCVSSGVNSRSHCLRRSWRRWWRSM